MEYPKAKYLRTGTGYDVTIVADAAEEKKLGKEWRDSPAEPPKKKAPAPGYE